MKWLVVMLVAGICLWSVVPAEAAKHHKLSTHGARVALDRRLALDQHHLGRCVRKTPKVIDCRAWIAGPAPKGESGYDEAWTIYRMRLAGSRVNVRFLDFVWV